MNVVKRAVLQIQSDAITEEKEHGTPSSLCFKTLQSKAAEIRAESIIDYVIPQKYGLEQICHNSAGDAAPWARQPSVRRIQFPNNYKSSKCVLSLVGQVLLEMDGTRL